MVSDIHSCETRGRESNRTWTLRTIVHQRLPSQVGPFFVNTLTKLMKSAVIPKVLKNRLVSSLIYEAIQNTDNFMVHDWDPCIANI